MRALTELLICYRVVHSEVSWEPEPNVAKCDRLLNSFWRNFPGDETDYLEGHVLTAPGPWIGTVLITRIFFLPLTSARTEREKTYFQKNFKNKNNTSEPKEGDIVPKRGKSKTKTGVKRVSLFISDDNSLP